MKEGLSNRLYFDVTSKSLNKKNEELCGDKVEVVRTGDDVIVVLSDGLGSGVKANILATLTSKIIATMMKSGATLEDTVDTIVHTLPVCKVRHMAYSTFSILKLTADGKAYLTEFDCPGCVWVHEGVVLPVDYTTREVGGKTIREASFDLSVGDMFLMFSDGVIYAGLGELMNLGWDWENVCDFVQDNCGKENTSARMTAADLTELDLAYAPPYSSAKDPVNMAGFMIENILDDLVDQVTWDEALELVAEDGDAILLDTRTAGERSRGGIEGALHIPVDELREHLQELPRDKRLLVFCASGLRSYVACRILSQHGFSCANVAGGYGFHTQVERGSAVPHACVGDCGLPV